MADISIEIENDYDITNKNKSKSHLTIKHFHVKLNPKTRIHSAQRNRQRCKEFVDVVSAMP